MCAHNRGLMFMTENTPTEQVIKLRIGKENTKRDP